MLPMKKMLRKGYLKATFFMSAQRGAHRIFRSAADENS